MWLGLYPLAVLSGQAARNAGPAAVEAFFSTGIYPPISRAVGGFFSIFPFSFAEFLLYGLIIAVTAFIVVCVVRAARRALPLRRFLNWLLTVLLIGGIGMNAFYWMWGFNYYRTTLAERMGLHVRDSNVTELEELCTLLAADANHLRAQVSTDADGIFAYRDGNIGVLRKIPAAYGKLREIYAEFQGAVYSPKPVFASEALSYAGISGIYIPFTEEANVNVDDPPLLVASSAAHETAHFLGIAREEEANFAAYLACTRSGDKELEYSGTMLALIYAGNALSAADSARYGDLYGTYSDAVRRDLAAYNAYLKAHEGQVSETVTEVNDNYLRSHAQTSGVQSYGEMVDLLLAFRRGGHT